MRVAAFIVALEAATVLVLGIAELIRLDASRPTVAVTTGAFFLVYAAGLAFAARALSRLRSWSRGPVVLAQLIELGVAWSFHGRATDWVAAVLAVPAVVVLVIVLAPTSTLALYGERKSDDDDSVPN